MLGSTGFEYSSRCYRLAQTDLWLRVAQVLCYETSVLERGFDQWTRIMFERYSQRATRVIFLARLKAGERGAEALEVEDLLVAFIAEDQGEFVRALHGLAGHGEPAPVGAPAPHRAYLPSGLAKSLLAQVDAVRTRAEPVPRGSDMPLSEGAKRALEAAAELRDELGQSEVQPLHLLAAIAADESSKGGRILKAAGVTCEGVVKAIREEARSVAAEGPAPAQGSGISVGPPVYSQRAREVSFLAGLKARMRGARTIEVEDLLAALLIEDQGGFLDAIAAAPGVGIDIAHVSGPHRPFLSPDLAKGLLARVEALCSRSQPLPLGTAIPMSEEAKRAIGLAGLLRDALQQDLIEPLHLLAAVLGIQPGTAAQMFLDAGITDEKIIDFIRQQRQTH